MTDEEKKKRIEHLKTQFDDCADIFVAIGDKMRQSLLFDIIDAGKEGIDVASLARKSTLSRPAVSHHLKVMKSVGILSPRKSGTQVFYSINLQSSGLEKIRVLVTETESLISDIKASSQFL